MNKHRGFLASVSLALVCVSGAVAQWDPPSGYYASATGVGATLRNQIHEIIDTNWWSPGSGSHAVRSYSNAILALFLLHRDPSNANNLILIYTGVSVPGAWDSGATWNREHTWPDSRGLGGSGMDYTDLHQLRPCNPSVNGSRGNDPFGVGGGSYWDPQPSTNPSLGPGSYVPGTNDRGEMARAMMYMDVRYDGGDSGTVDLVLVNGFPAGNQMGDLAQLLEWHYTDPVNDTERLRNHLVFSNTDNPSYFQGNRNPFVDRPEFVWALWGTSPNDSQLSVAAPAGSGASNANVNLRVIAGTADAAAVTLSKTGSTPTTYNATMTGSGVSVTGLGSGKAFTYGAGSSVLWVTPTSVATPSVSNAVVTIDNTDLTSSGAGRGSADANDTITITSSVLSASNPSWQTGSDVNSGLVTSAAEAGSGVVAVSVPLYNFGWSATRALMEIDGVSGGAAGFGTPGFDSGLVGAGSAMVSLSFDTTGATAGVYSASYTVMTSDEDVPGETASSVMLTWEVTVSAAPVPCDGDANGDGFVNFADITSVLADLGGTGPVGDANGDGMVNFSDITSVLGNLGLACE